MARLETPLLHPTIDEYSPSEQFSLIGGITAKLGSDAPQLAALELALPSKIPRGLPRGVSFNLINLCCFSLSQYVSEALVLHALSLNI